MVPKIEKLNTCTIILTKLNILNFTIVIFKLVILISLMLFSSYKENKFKFKVVTLVMLWKIKC